MRLAKGLAAFLNSSLVDLYFRQFSGHSQVNATDLRMLRYPTRSMLERVGTAIKTPDMPKEELDGLVLKELF
jgi:adenine-specific DNA-methyltransferase